MEASFWLLCFLAACSSTLCTAQEFRCDDHRVCRIGDRPEMPCVVYLCDDVCKWNRDGCDFEVEASNPHCPVALCHKVPPPPPPPPPTPSPSAHTPLVVTIILALLGFGGATSVGVLIYWHRQRLSELLHIRQRNDDDSDDDGATSSRWRAFFCPWSRAGASWPWARLGQQREEQDEQNGDEVRSGYASRIWETASRWYRERQNNENTTERIPLLERFRRAALGANREEAEHVGMNQIATYQYDRDNDPLGVWQQRGRGIQNENSIVRQSDII